eukprot:194684_1
MIPRFYPTERTYCYPAHYPVPRCKLEEQSGDIELDEVRQHNKRNDFWVTFDGNVYDISKMTKKNKNVHKKLLFAGGQDLEPLYNYFRDHYVNHEIPFINNFKIGHLSKCGKQVVEQENQKIQQSIKTNHIEEHSMWRHHFSFADQYGSILHYNDYKI